MSIPEVESEDHAMVERYFDSKQVKQIFSIVLVVVVLVEGIFVSILDHHRERSNMCRQITVCVRGEGLTQDD